MSQRLHILYVANKRLPDNDYRMAYRKWSRRADVVYGLPGCPASLEPHAFTELDFGEGIALRDLRSFFVLTRYLRSHRPKYDLVHFFSTKLQLLGPLCAALADVPSVTTITGFGRIFGREELRYRALRPLYLALARRFLGLARAVFFQNRGDMEWLGQRLPSVAPKMHWIGSGVEAEIVSRKDFRKQPLTVLMVTRVMAEKGVRIFVEAARRLRGTAYRFVLVGPASVGQISLHREMMREHNRGTIDYRGELGRRELASLYREGHLFVLPSRYGEGMPRVMLEAGYGLMCPVASDIPAHRDLIGPGRGCRIESTCEVESLVSHLAKLNANRADLEHNARAYQKHILDYYTMEAYAGRMDTFLHNLFPRMPFPAEGRAA